MSFKIGDLVKALPSSNRMYDVTNEENRCEGEVTQISEDRGVIELKITNHKYYQHKNERYFVRSKYFELITPEVDEKEFEELVGF